MLVETRPITWDELIDHCSRLHTTRRRPVVPLDLWPECTETREDSHILRVVAVGAEMTVVPTRMHEPGFYVRRDSDGEIWRDPEGLAVFRKMVENGSVVAALTLCDECGGRGWIYSGAEYAGHRERVDCPRCVEPLALPDDLYEQCGVSPTNSTDWLPCNLPRYHDGMHRQPSRNEPHQWDGNEPCFCGRGERATLHDLAASPALPGPPEPATKGETVVLSPPPEPFCHCSQPPHFPHYDRATAGAPQPTREPKGRTDE